MTRFPRLNQQDFCGYTLVHCAISKYDMMILNACLKKNDINLNLTTKYGQTPLDIARQLAQSHGQDYKMRRKHYEVSAILQEAGVISSAELEVMPSNKVMHKQYLAYLDKR